jgi:YbbR domain-containing protein
MDTLLIQEKKDLAMVDINTIVRYDREEYIVSELHKTLTNTKVVLKGDKGMTREINISVSY